MHGNMHNCIVYNYIYVFPTIAALTLSLHYLYNCMFSHCTPCVCFPWLCIHIIACFHVLHTSCRFPCHSRQHPSLPTNWEVSHATNPPSLPGTSADVTFSYIFLRTLCTSTYCLCFTSQHQPINWPTPPTHSRFFLSWVDLCTLHSWLNIYVHLFCTYNIYVDLGAWFGLPLPEPHCILL